MVVHELNVGRDSGTPGEDDAELVIDADTAARAKRPLEVLEAVTWRNSEVRLAVCGMKQVELPTRDGPKFLRQFPRSAAVDAIEDVASHGVGKGLDHALSVPLARVLCKRVRHAALCGHIAFAKSRSVVRSPVALTATRTSADPAVLAVALAPPIRSRAPLACVARFG
jgi:hypothetical protein